MGTSAIKSPNPEIYSKNKKKNLNNFISFNLINNVATHKKKKKKMLDNSYHYNYKDEKKIGVKY